MLPQDRSLHEIEIRIAQNEPFCAGGFKIYFHASMGALAFAVENHSVPELAMAYALTEADTEFGPRGHGGFATGR